jgi:hypothetical protein
MPKGIEVSGRKLLMTSAEKMAGKGNGLKSIIAWNRPHP